MNKVYRIFTLLPLLLLPLTATPAEQMRTETVGDVSQVRSIVIDRGLTEQGKKCVSCHTDVNPGIINDWKNSRHAHVGVSCLDCHQVEKGSPTAVPHGDLIDKSRHDASMICLLYTSDAADDL